MIVHGRYALGVIVLALGVAGLALAHNIFFLYTGVLLGILFVFSLPDWRAALALVLGGLGGLLLAGVQWYPALLSQSDLVVNFLDRRTVFRSARLISAAGLWGWLRPFVVPNPPGSISYYFTFAWWTLPAAAASFWVARRDPSRQPVVFALLAASVVFFLLIIPPMDFWAVLPPPFAALQFTYRLIAFVALFSAISIAVALPSLSWTALLWLVPLMILSQWPVFRVDPYSLGKLGYSDAQVVSNYSASDFACMSPPKSRASDLSYSDGAMKQGNLLHLHSEFGPASSPTLGLAGYNESPGLLRIRMMPLGNVDQELFTENQSDVLVPPGAFSLMLPLNAKFVDQRIVGSPQGRPSSASSESPPQSIRLRSALQSKEPAPFLLPADCLEEVGRHGYSRTFRVLPSAVERFGPTGSLRSGDGWLREDNLIRAGQRTLRLRGTNRLDRTVQLFGAKLEEPAVPLTGVMDIPPGHFDLTVPLEGLPLPLRLFYSPYMMPHDLDPNSLDRRRLALSLEDHDPVPGDWTYSTFILQTPVAYNRFWKVWQDGEPVTVFSDEFYHLCVKLQRPGGILTIRYVLPRACWALSLAGLVLCGIQPWLWKKLS